MTDVILQSTQSERGAVSELPVLPAAPDGRAGPARHWIGGAWTSSATVATSINPSTGEALGDFYSGGRKEAASAIAAARKAFDTGSWSHDRSLRSNALMELAYRFEERATRLQSMIARENGKILRHAALETHVAPITLRHNAGLALSQRGSASEIGPGLLGMSLREPLGVAGLIVPWNAPLALFVRALGPALAAGCTAVVKLPAQTALTNALIAEAVAATESLPAGVVNIFTELGNEGAPLLVESSDVDVVNFTGSTRTGRKIAEAAAKSLKRLSLELGGKTPLVIFEDTDIDKVAPLVVAALTTFNGQFCMTGSRVLVQASVADAWRARLAMLLEKLVVGRADAPESQLGPLIDKASVERVEGIVSDAARYATAIVRGGPIVDGPLAAGAFYRPAMLETRELDVPLIQQEIFGPVLSFETFIGESEALDRANATEFGLAASVFTRDIDRAQRVVRRLKAGTVWINRWAALSDSYEEGGFKQSGIGRARGDRGVEEFQEMKTCFQAIAGADGGGLLSH